MCKRAVFSVFVSISVLAFSCAGSGKRPVSSPEEMPKRDYMAYFTLGKQAYDAGAIDKAIASLEQSLAGNPDYTPAGELLGAAFLEKGETDKAFDAFSKVLAHDAHSINARTGMGRILLMRQDYNAAVEAFDTVLSIDNANAEAYFYRGVVLHELGYEFRSHTSFIRAIINDRSYRPTIEKLIPLTDPEIGKLFKEEYLSIENKSMISRAEMAAILVTIICDKRIFAPGDTVFVPPQLFKEPQQPSIADVSADNWAYNEINTAVTAGLMELYPDESFKPERTVKKADFAALLQKVIIKLVQKPELATRYIGMRSSYKDLNSSHWAYNACRLSVEYKLLEPLEPDFFGLAEPVSGIAAIDALEKLNVLKQ